MTIATIKIGTNRGKRRIWLEGKRLVEAGFKGGVRYGCAISEGEIVLTLPGDDRKVTGREDGKPVIDIIGGAVERAFPGAEKVLVSFEAGRISIAPVAEEQRLAA